MKVEELIKQLQTMPQNSHVSVLDGGGLEDVEEWTGIIGDPLNDELDGVISRPKEHETASE